MSSTNERTYGTDWFSLQKPLQDTELLGSGLRNTSEIRVHTYFVANDLNILPQLEAR